MHDNVQQQLRPATRSKASLRVQPLHPLVSEPSRTPAVSSVLAPLFGREVLEQAFHALQHQLRTISAGVDTLWLTQTAEIEEREKIIQALKRAEQVLHELQEYCFPLEFACQPRT